MERVATPLAYLVFLVLVPLHICTYFDLEFARIYHLLDVFQWFAILAGAVFILMTQKRIANSEDFFKVGGETAPWLLGGLFFPLMPYVLMNVFLCMALLQGGNPEAINGSYYLLQKGIIIKEIDYTEYNQLLGYQLRLFSGHWVVIGWGALL